MKMIFKIIKQKCFNYQNGFRFNKKNSDVMKAGKK